jgi:hypothetical protein
LYSGSQADTSTTTEGEGEGGSEEVLLIELFTFPKYSGKTFQ